MCLCVCVRICVSMHACAHIHTDQQRACILAFTRAQILSYVNTARYTRASTHARMHANTHFCLCPDVCMHACMYPQMRLSSDLGKQTKRRDIFTHSKRVHHLNLSLLSTRSHLNMSLLRTHANMNMSRIFTHSNRVDHQRQRAGCRHRDGLCQALA